MQRFAAIAALIVLGACAEDDTPTPTPAQLPDASQTVQAPPQDNALVADSAQAMAERLAALPAPYSDASLANGSRQFRRCTACHTIGDGGPHRVGPNLHDMFGRQVGSADGFNYSAALRQADFAWTAEHLDSWLADPRGYLPGNRMTFAGLRNEEDRRDLIAYLMLETGL